MSAAHATEMPVAARNARRTPERRTLSRAFDTAGEHFFHASPSRVRIEVQKLHYSTGIPVAAESRRTEHSRPVTGVESRWEDTVPAGKRGFASMDREKQRAIARMGGKAAHQKGTAHEWTRDEAREAGRKGGVLSHRPRQAQKQDENTQPSDSYAEFLLLSHHLL